MTDQCFMISGLNEQLHQELQYNLLKPDCHSNQYQKMQSGHEEILEEWYAIKLCFKLGKNATETYEMLQTAIIREQLKMRKICMNFVPRVLTEDQK